MRADHHGDRPGLFRNLVPLVLASASPRRRELLSALGLEFEIFPAEIEETFSLGASPEDVVQELARAKAQAVARWFPRAAVLAADTLVVKRGRLLGKPKDIEGARAMLRNLSGTWHRVYTGVCILYGKEEVLFFSETAVKFRKLLPEEVEAYLATGEPLDKAGAYAIQGLAAAFVEAVHGSVTGVVGLPLSETVEALLRLKIIAPLGSKAPNPMPSGEDAVRRA